jgi:hypothetical protein
MQPNQDTLRRSTDAREPRRTPRVRQADRFEILAAASEAEDVCPIWIADHLSEGERVSS